MINLAYLAATGLIITGLISIYALVEINPSLLEKIVPHFLNFALFLLMFNVFKNSSVEVHTIISLLFFVGAIASVVFSIKRLTNECD